MTDHTSTRHADSSGGEGQHHGHSGHAGHQHRHQGHAAHDEHDEHHHGHDEHPHHGHAGHDHGAMIADFRKRFYVVLVLTVPVLLLSDTISHWLHLHIAFAGAPYLLLALSTAIFLYGGWPFLSGGVSELKAANPGMMTLIGMAITVAYAYSAAIVLGLHGMDFFWELATLILVMLLGHWIEMKSVAGASRELELLVQLMPASAHLVKGGDIADVKAESLQVNDIILVRPGEKIAADGVITDGESHVDESMLTGESVPVHKSPGQQVIAGALNGNGALKIRVTHSGKNAYLFKVVELVKNAQAAKSNTQLLADKAARWLTVIALLAGIGTFATWLWLGRDLAFAMERMVTVMVICCPHALGLAIPLVVAKSTTLAAQHGLLIKNRTAFEQARKVTTVVFDKTGTLTKGKFEVTRIGSPAGKTDAEVLQLAAAPEANSEHPIAAGIVAEAKKRQISLPPVAGFRAITGKGVEAVVDGKNIKVVSPGYLTEQHIALPAGLEIAGNETLVFVLQGDEVAGFIALADAIRPESATAIQTLHHYNIRSVLLTGDNEKVAESVSRQLQMDGFFAGVLPHQKLEKIKNLQQQGEFIAMTGDGVNDAPALAQADVLFAVGSGSDIAAETAGIVLVNSDPQDVVSLILFGRATYRKMVQNLAWATGYNLITLPLAAGILYNQAIVVGPATGAVLMTVSTVVVAINAGLLKVKVK